MKDKIETYNPSDYDDILDFSSLPDYITTVNIILEHIELTETDIHGDAEPYYDFSKETVAMVKKLDTIHSHEDHLFDAKNNVVISKEEVKRLYEASEYDLAHPDLTQSIICYETA